MTNEVDSSTLQMGCKKIARVDDVAKWRLCLGCGACVVSCDQKAITMKDICDQGLRPLVDGSRCNRCGMCLRACPGLGIAYEGSDEGDPSQSFRKSWGSFLEIWEGYATDPEIRFLGSSGGAATALALFCVEQGLVEGVLHVGKDQGEPWRNRTMVSRSRAELLSNTGSRYSPASPCEGLGLAEQSSSPFAFVGKPCDMHGLRKLQMQRTRLKESITLAIGIFCAGTPSTQGLLDLLDKLQTSRNDVQDIRFRGKGWPGLFSVGLRNGHGRSPSLSYAESWGFLNRYRPFRCSLCPDGTSEFADISCGDPWYREPSGGDPGRSMVLVRTERGREILQAALKAGYLNLEKADPKIIKGSQINLLNKRRAVWGRIAAMKAFGLPTPDYEGFPLLSNWMELPVGGKARSFLGTARRILTRGYRKPLNGGRSHP